MSRWVSLIVIAALVSPWLRSVLPVAAVSPFVALVSAVAARSVGIITLIGLPMLILAVLVPRVFCRFVCPVGFLQEMAARLRLPGRARWRSWPRVGRWFLWLTIGGALAGYPLFVWLDPLALFTGFFSAFRLPTTIATIGAGALLPLAMLLDVLFPGAWCKRMCPLGALQEALAIAKQSLANRTRATDESLFSCPHSPVIPTSSPFALARRPLIASLVGGAGALLARHTAAKPPPLRPPGSLPEDQFTGVCIRCSGCIRVCPSRILKPDLGQHGLAGLLAPVADFDTAYCKEDCNACGQVCPSGAIQRLSLAEKKRSIMGIAKVELSRCWLAEGRDCTACIRSCPYEALSVSSDGFDSHPALDASKCIGCGACEAACPARPERAIRVFSNNLTG
ncbi:MAG: 4Fe-4S binding protein [Verrucomicrobiaceae bacterium]|nr:4Fe-4S binding protein [Verrucomicrobiaceae bacterium]